MRRPYNGTYSITRPFGVYDEAYANYPGSRHPGCDYGLPYRTPLVAAILGTAQVIDRGTAKTGRGREVVVTNGSTQVKYCHMDSFSVSNGQQVTEGQTIGYSGFTGYVMDSAGNIGTIGGTHLHFEVLIGGVYTNPEAQYNQVTKGDVMVDSEDVYKLFQGFRNRQPSKGELDQFVGKWTHKALIQALSSGPDRELVVKQLTTGITALQDNWAKQISDLSSRLASESTVLSPGKYLVK